MLNDFLILMKNELVITAVIFLLLFVKLSKGMKNETLLALLQVLLLGNVILGFFFNKTGFLFNGMYHTSPLLAFEKNILAFGVYLITLLCSGWLKKNQHLPEYMLLLLSALLGMNLMISSGNMLMFYLSLELSSIPVAAMANFDLSKRQSGEAGMKMILSSAFSSGILLFGISLIYGATGSISFGELGQLVDGSSPLAILGFIFIVAGFAFKLSVVPFHFWTADVYEGAPVPTAAFLSVISKGAVAFIFLMVLAGVFGPMQKTWYILLMILSLATMITGNLFALRQNNLKRFLAYSSIAQVGFILVAMLALGNGEIIREGVASIVYFVLIYAFSNLAAFGVVSIISTRTGKESISDLKGFYQNNKLLSWVLALALFSLAGIPPTAGFFGKLFLVMAGAANSYLWFVVIVALNLIVSLYYYLRVVRSVFMDKNESPAETVPVDRSEKFGLFICAAGIVAAGMIGLLYEYIKSLI